MGESITKIGASVFRNITCATMVQRFICLAFMQDYSGGNNGERLEYVLLGVRVINVKL